MKALDPDAILEPEAVATPGERVFRIGRLVLGTTTIEEDGASLGSGLFVGWIRKERPVLEPEGTIDGIPYRIIDDPVHDPVPPLLENPRWPAQTTRSPVDGVTGSE